MSTEAAQPHSLATGDLHRLRTKRRALRLAFGTATGFTVANALDWPAALLTPIMFIQLSVGLRACPTLGSAAGVIAAVAACVGIGWLVTTVVGIPTLCVLLIATLLFAAFYVQAGRAGGLAPFVLMVAVCVLPVVALQAAEAAMMVAAELISASIAAFFLVWVTWAAFPDPRMLTPPPSPRAAAPVASARARARVALVNTAVLIPVEIAFLVFDLTNAIVALITTIAIVRTQTHAIRLGMVGALLQGNVLAGLAALGAGSLIMAWPSLPMLFFSVLVVALLFADWLTAAEPARASTYVVGLTSSIALLDGSLSAFSEGAGEDVYQRLVYVAAAIAYILGALALTEGLRPKRSDK
jgi:Protein of unknown function (DUF2955)